MVVGIEIVTLTAGQSNPHHLDQIKKDQHMNTETKPKTFMQALRTTFFSNEPVGKVSAEIKELTPKDKADLSGYMLAEGIDHERYVGEAATAAAA